VSRADHVKQSELIIVQSKRGACGFECPEMSQVGLSNSHILCRILCIETGSDYDSTSVLHTALRSSEFCSELSIAIALGYDTSIKRYNGKT
jgi:hypothetical protein